VKTTQLIPIAVVLALATCPGRATVSFQNDGTTNGWSTLWHEDGQGFDADVKSPAFQDSTAIQCRTVFRTTYGGRYHTEVRKSGQATMGMDRYYGFCFYLPANWQFVDQSFNIQQFIGNADGCSGGQPITMTHLQNHALITRIVTGPDGCTRTSHPFTVVTDVTPGAWHRVVIHGKWAADNTGVFEFWYDGVKRISQVNTPTCPNANTSFNLALGNYSNGWHDDGFMVGTQAVRDIFIDHVRTGSTFAEVNPTAWSESGAGSAYVRITSRSSGLAANVNGSSTADGATIIQWPYSADSNYNDEWLVTDIGGGYSTLENRKSGKVVSVSGASTTNGAPLVQWTYNNNSSHNDEWQIAPTSSGFMKILNRNSGQAINIRGNSLTNGAPLIQWPYSANTTYNDEWQLINVP